tara:strand:- start:900 stop:1367 length:468 start_codon:yes stop_codon:yes gene_type:complete
MNEDLPYIPNIDALNPPKTIFYPPVADAPYLNPVLLPSLEQVQSGLAEERATSSEEETTSSKEEVSGLKPELLPTNLPESKETLPSANTFTIPFYGEMPIPAPEVIASSLIASSVSATAAVVGGIAMQSVVKFIKKVSKKIFTKVLKKEIADSKK